MLSDEERRPRGRQVEVAFREAAKLRQMMRRSCLKRDFETESFEFLPHSPQYVNLEAVRWRNAEPQCG